MNRSVRAEWGRCIEHGNTKLDRDVAIKVLPEDFANDLDRLARLERDAKLLDDDGRVSKRCGCLAPASRTSGADGGRSLKRRPRNAGS